MSGEINLKIEYFLSSCNVIVCWMLLLSFLAWWLHFVVISDENYEDASQPSNEHVFTYYCDVNIHVKFVKRR